MKLEENDLISLKRAVDVLEHPVLTAKITDLIGMPIEKALGYLPEKWSKTVTTVTHEALRKSLDLSIYSMDLKYDGTPSNAIHKLLNAASGGLGGAFGLLTLSVELPVSTTIMLRSIADIARSEGEDLNDVEPQLALCLFFFSSVIIIDDFACEL